MRWRTNTQDVARFLFGALAVGGYGTLISGRGAVSRLTRGALRTLALDPLVRRLKTSRNAEHRGIAEMLATALAAEEYNSVLGLVSNAVCAPDLRAEKILSHRYRYLWICNPKVASRSLIAALRASDPDAVLIRGLNLDRVYARFPEATNFYSFAFLRHPWHRTWSFYADKHAKACRERKLRRWFIDPYFGITLGMSFGELCAWLNTPCGSDAFADRHWLSQSLQVATADGRLPDFLGSYETLEADWRDVIERLGMPFTELPRLNARPAHMAPEPDDGTIALVKRRYAADFELGGYAADPR